MRPCGAKPNKQNKECAITMTSFGSHNGSRKRAALVVRTFGLLIAISVLCGVTALHTPVARAQQEIAETSVGATPAWLEPRAISVVDLVGLVPDEHLRDAIVTFTGGAGILQYIEGSRSGNTVTIRVRVSPRYPQPGMGTTTMNCLGKRALHDEWPIFVPASTARIYSGGRDITHQAFAVWHYETGLIQPSGNAFNPEGRYKEYEDRQSLATFAEDGTLLLPANSGCTIFLFGEHADMTAEFRFEVESRIKVEYLGSQTETFRSYVGIGEAGVLEPLQQQLINRFTERHDKFFLTVPPGADYVFVKYPPTPVSPYSGSHIENIVLPSSGTYRLANGDKDLSVDHTASAGIPYLGQWLDADIEKHKGVTVGVDYLMPLPAIDTIASPEYFVPEGIAFDPCMLNGTCSNTLLREIFNKQMQLVIHYYRIERISGELVRIPLRQVGREWQPRHASVGESDVAADEAEAVAPATSTFPPLLYLPVLTNWQASPPDDPTGCPCGWFTADGRMLDYVPPLLEQ